MPRNEPIVFGMTRNTGQLHCEVKMPVLLRVSSRLIFKMGYVAFGINQCVINYLTLVNKTVGIWMLRFAKRMCQV